VERSVVSDIRHLLRNTCTIGDQRWSAPTVVGLEGILDRTRIPKEMPASYRTHVRPSPPVPRNLPRQTGHIAPGAPATGGTGRRSCVTDPTRERHETGRRHS